MTALEGENDEMDAGGNDLRHTARENGPDIRHLDRCLIVEGLMRSQQLEKLYGWQAAVRKTGGSFWTFWTEEPLAKRRFGLENQATCIPHAGPVTNLD